MTTTRYFEVKVTGCKNCPRTGFEPAQWGHLSHHYCGAVKVAGQRVFEENFNKLTPTCPMWDQSKESETK